MTTNFEVNMNIQIQTRLGGKLLFEAEAPSIKVALELALKSGADLSNADLSNADLIGADLSNADLSNADLIGADLIGAYLRGADLRDANLSGAYLRGADLRDANLSGAYLSGADLRNAYLSGADLSNAYLSGADLSNAYLSGADLSNAYLSGADLSGADLSGADLRGADLRGVNENYIDPATPDVAIANLDKVREIIMDNASRLEMGHWHSDMAWKERTFAEETLCETTHCLAGWLQVCSTDKNLRNLDPQFAGALAAPIAAKMFFRGQDETLEWLKERKYVAEIAEREQRAAERKAKREAANESV
jgi:uncharacterized protein YjbI with pentapeptide repeats